MNIGNKTTSLPVNKVFFFNPPFFSHWIERTVWIWKKKWGSVEGGGERKMSLSTASYLARRAAQKQKVRLLYRRALRDTLNWAVHRHLFYQDVIPQFFIPFLGFLLSQIEFELPQSSHSSDLLVFLGWWASQEVRCQQKCGKFMSSLLLLCFFVFDCCLNLLFFVNPNCGSEDFNVWYDRTVLLVCCADLHTLDNHQ